MSNLATQSKERIPEPTESAPTRTQSEAASAGEASPSVSAQAPGQNSRKRSRAPLRYRRALLSVFVLLLMLAAWWGSSYLFAYTDDAYLTSDLVSITPEVSGPIKAVNVT